MINQDSPDYIKSWDEFTFLPGSLEAFARLHQNGFETIIISNQSILNRHLSTLAHLETIFFNMRRAVQTAGGKITDIFYCPHTPEEHCSCRKPKPGLFHAARDKYGLDLTRTIMVGDSAKDIEAARNADCGWTVLVQTGNGQQARQQLSKKKMAPSFIATDLNHASRWIINQFCSPPIRS